MKVISIDAHFTNRDVLSVLHAELGDIEAIRVKKRGAWIEVNLTEDGMYEIWEFNSGDVEYNMRYPWSRLALVLSDMGVNLAKCTGFAMGDGYNWWRF